MMLMVRRAFRTSVSLRGMSGKNPEWVAMTRDRKRREDNKWKLRQGHNPYAGNKGAARVFRHVLNDDEVIRHRQFRPDDALNEDPAEAFERFAESTEAFRRDLYRSNRFKGPQGERLKRVLAKKNFFPEPKSPNLLTWTEKEVMRHLHRTEPGEWTPEKLSECFPATPYIVRKVLRNDPRPAAANLPAPELQARIRNHDLHVLENWKKLAKRDPALLGDIPDDLKEHLAEFKEPNQATLAVMMSAEEAVLESPGRSPDTANPNRLKGPFGRILGEYNAKCRALEKRASDDDGDDVGFVVSSNLMSEDDSLRNELNKRSPFTGTSLVQGGSVNVHDLIRKERLMTMDTFLDKRLRPRLKREVRKLDQNGAVNIAATAYRDFVEQEATRIKAETASRADRERTTPKLSADNVLSER